MKSKKILLISLIGLISLGSMGILLTGCSNLSHNQGSNEEVQSGSGPVYSNLVDEKTQEEVKTALENKGIQGENVNKFMTWVNDYNTLMKSSDILKGEFQPINMEGNTYDDLWIEQRVNKEGQPYSEINCRLTSYLLFEDFVSVENNVKDVDNYLMFDIDAMENNPLIHFSEEERAEFSAVFNPISVPNTKDKAQHITSIQKEWEKRGVTFKNEEDISLLTLWIHDPYEQKRFIGHIGVLINEGDTLMLVEKYGANKPFQVSKFQNKQQAVEYFLSRNDIYGDRAESDVIIMNNKEVLY